MSPPSGHAASEQITLRAGSLEFGGRLRLVPPDRWGLSLLTGEGGQGGLAHGGRGAEPGQSPEAERGPGRSVLLRRDGLCGGHSVAAVSKAHHAAQSGRSDGWSVLYLLDEVGQGLLAPGDGGLPAEDHVSPADL